jgi:hypothetical protein
MNRREFIAYAGAAVAVPMLPKFLLGKSEPPFDLTQMGADDVVWSSWASMGAYGADGGCFINPYVFLYLFTDVRGPVESRTLDLCTPELKLYTDTLDCVQATRFAQSFGILNSKLLGRFNMESGSRETWIPSDGHRVKRSAEEALDFLVKHHDIDPEALPKVKSICDEILCNTETFGPNWMVREARSNKVLQEIVNDV